MSPYQPSLLRRTAVALAAVAGFFISTGTQAATVTLSGATGNSCTYSTMAVQPDGSFSVQCLASTTPTPGALSLSQPPASVVPGATVALSAFRSGTSGAVSGTFTVSGAGCTNTSGTVSWADADANAKPISVAALVSGSCTIALSAPTGGATLGTPSSVSFTVVQATPSPTPGPTPSASCPAGYSVPANLLEASLGGPGNVLLQMQGSNQVVSIPLPDAQPGYATGQIAFGESAGGAYTPQPVTINITISKCKGYIDTDTSNRCNLVNTNGNYNAITWFAQPYSIITDAASANDRGYCWAPKSDGPWYVNARWTYSSCAFGAAACGFAIQQNYGPY